MGHSRRHPGAQLPPAELVRWAAAAVAPPPTSEEDADRAELWCEHIHHLIRRYWDTSYNKEKMFGNRDETKNLVALGKGGIAVAQKRQDSADKTSQEPLWLQVSCASVREAGVQLSSEGYRNEEAPARRQLARGARGKRMGALRLQFLPVRSTCGRRSASRAVGVAVQPRVAALQPGKGRRGVAIQLDAAKWKGLRLTQFAPIS